MDLGACLLVAAAIGKVVWKLRSFLSNYRDSHEETMKMLDLLEDKVQILCSEHPLHLHVKPDKELAAAEWLWRLNKATNEAQELLRDMETDQVNTGISNATQASSGDRGHAPSQVIDWVRSDNDNLLRMESTIGRLASLCAEGGSIVDIPNLEKSHLVDLNKQIVSLPSNISRNETKLSPDDPLIIGRDEEITVLLDMVLGDACYATSSLEGREESDKLQISQKGWVVKAIESLDLLDASHVGSEEVTYQNEMWSKVQYTRITNDDTITDLRNPTVIPIVGIGGVGKTALAQLIFNEESVQKHFGGQSAWVYVTDNISEEKIMELIIASFIDQDALTYTKDLHIKLESIIGGRRFLLVLDDAWGDICSIWCNLHSILSKGEPGSVILVTTRLYEVASFMGTTCPVVLNPLQSGDLWKLIPVTTNMQKIWKKLVET